MFSVTSVFFFVLATQCLNNCSGPSNYHPPPPTPLRPFFFFFFYFFSFFSIDVDGVYYGTCNLRLGLCYCDPGRYGDDCSLSIKLAFQVRVMISSIFSQLHAQEVSLIMELLVILPLEHGVRF